MANKDDFYITYTRQFSIKVVKELAQFLCDRLPENHSFLFIALCKMFCNQKYDTKYSIDEDALAELVRLTKIYRKE